MLVYLCVFHFALAAPLSAKTNETMELEEVLVQASPIIEGNTVDDFGALTTVVSQDQMERLNAQDLGTALRKTPGVSISRYNPIGSFGGGEGGGVFIRGMGSSRPGAEIKTFVDGVPMYMSVWNHPLLDLMSIDAAQSIEVFKGPQPQKFGNAFSAINLKTKRQDQGSRTKAKLAGGSYSTLINTVEHGTRRGRWDYYVGGGYRTSDGHRDDADGTLKDLYGRIGYQLADNWDVSLFSMLTDNEASDPGARGAPESAKEGDYETQAFLTSLTLSHAYDWGQGSLKLYQNQGEGDWMDQPTSTPGVREDLFNNFQFYGLRASEEFTLWPGGNIQLGLDWEVAEGDWDKKFSDGKKEDWEGPDLTTVSPYAGVSQFLGQRSGFYLIPSAGARYTDHSEFNAEWAPHAGLVLGYKDTQLHANYSRGVVYPGLDVIVFSETVIPPLGQSWKDLDPETIDHYELGIEHKFCSFAQADITFFYDDGRDRYVFTTPPAGFAYQNIEDFEIRGIETTLQLDPTQNLSIFAGLTWLDTDPSDLPYAPDVSISSGVNWTFLDQFTVSLDSQYLDSMTVTSQARKAGAENTSKVDSYFLLNGKLSYGFALEHSGLEGELFVAGENLTDTDYEYLPDYPMPGINGMLGISLEL
ncbi:MAG: TonB-dependent receptor, partial [Desulfovermiculus sp.]